MRVLIEGGGCRDGGEVTRMCPRSLGLGKGGGRLRPVRDAFGRFASPVHWYLGR